ncbi:hypothetical protein HaLaN_18872, partial [Haematococcus lacustris]
MSQHVHTDMSAACDCKLRGPLFACRLGTSPSSSCIALLGGSRGPAGFEHRAAHPTGAQARPTNRGLIRGIADRSELRAARSRQTVPAMVKRHKQHQVPVDGGASATDGYSPSGEAHSPATRLLDLPPMLLDDIACRVMQLGARSMLHMTCRAFSQAHLLHVPALRIQLGRQCCDQLLTPRVVAALQARKSKLTLTLWQLALTLWQPETKDCKRYRKQLAPTLQLPQTEDTKHYTDLLAHALAKLDKCAAVEHLLDSFPSLTALTLQGLCVSSAALASLLSHPPLALQLQQLDIAGSLVMVGDAPGAVVPLFQGLQLKQLSIAA